MASGRADKRVVLLHDDEARLLLFEQALAAQCYRVVGRYDLQANLTRVLTELKPDMVLISVDLPTDAFLETLRPLCSEHAMPMVLFAARSSASLTRRALQTGVSDYIVDGLDPARLKSLFDVAVTRFELEQKLRHELDEARTRLADHRDIGKAKGLIMKRRELDEDEAYQLLRKMAMDRKQRIGDFSRLLLVASAAL